MTMGIDLQKLETLCAEAKATNVFETACTGLPVFELEALIKAADALASLVKIIDAAGLLNLSNGVQLGATVWYVKATERMDYARESLKTFGDHP